MSIKKIGVENFRVFKNYTEFEIRPITLLTGPNNSGKSSFSKLLLLLQNGIQNLNFTIGSHNLENFDKVITWESNKDFILLELTNTIPILNDSFKTQFEIRNGELSKVSIKSPTATLLSVEFQEDRSMIEYGSINFLQIVNFNMNYFINLIYSKNFNIQVTNKNQTKNGKNEYDWVPLKDIKKEKSGHVYLLSQLNKDLQKKVKFYEQSEAFHKRNQAIIKEIDSLPTDYLLFDVYLFGSPLSDDQKEKVLTIQDSIFKEIVCSNNFGMKVGSKNFHRNYSVLIDQLYLEAEIEFIAEIKKVFEIQDISVRKSRLGKLIFEELIFKDNFEQFLSNPHPIKKEDIQNFERIHFSETLFDQFKNLKFELSDYLDHTHYISPIRGNQRRVLMNSSENEIDKLVRQFSKLNKSDQNLPFLKKALEILEIDGNLNIERFENFISVISLNHNEKKITLADLGFGYSQIIPIILKIILVNNEFNPTANLIIEEPEANLHPNLQSKLADILSLSLATFPNTSFIIETHSEYLIRKLQYLTGSKELSNNQSVIYYFNADKYVSNKEPKVKKIEIDQNGNLTDSFGPGFYDEATRLQFDLLKINREQNN